MRARLEELRNEQKTLVERTALNKEHKLVYTTLLEEEDVLFSLLQLTYLLESDALEVNVVEERVKKMMEKLQALERVECLEKKVPAALLGWRGKLVKESGELSQAQRKMLSILSGSMNCRNELIVTLQRVVQTRQRQKETARESKDQDAMVSASVRMDGLNLE